MIGCPDIPEHDSQSEKEDLDDQKENATDDDHYQDTIRHCHSSMFIRASFPSRLVRVP